jgi:hypothetical protein
MYCPPRPTRPPRLNPQNQSPSPSEPEERLQEDRNIGTPTSPAGGINQTTEMDDAGASPADGAEVDLDGDVEDMDDSEVVDASGEIDDLSGVEGDSVDQQ